MIVTITLFIIYLQNKWRWLSLSSMCICIYFQIDLLIQCIITANIVVLGQGCAIGWLSPTLPILQSENSPLESGKLTIDEASWVGSISSIGSVIGTIYFGLISIYVGSKNTLILCAFPVTVSFSQSIICRLCDWLSFCLYFRYFGFLWFLLAMRGIYVQEGSFRVWLQVRFCVFSFI